MKSRETFSKQFCDVNSQFCALFPNTPHFITLSFLNRMPQIHDPAASLHEADVASLSFLQDIMTFIPLL
jgi:hypothetical protein